MSKLISKSVVQRNWVIDKVVAWVGENRKDKQCNYANLPSNVLCMGEKDQPNLKVDNALDTNLLGQLVHDLAWERSGWTFVVEQNYHSPDVEGGYAIADKVTIMEKLEPIGILERESAGAISVRNQRIKQDLWHKAYRETTKLKRAKQIINKDVYALTIDEVLRQSTSRIKDNMREATGVLAQTMRDKFTPISEWVREELMHFSPELIAFSEKMGRAEIVFAYIEAVENNALGMGVKQDIDVGQGRMVVIKGDEYHVANLGGMTDIGGEFHKRYTRFNRDTLAPDLHTALALLKLTEPNTFIQGKGFKVSDTEYFIVEEIKIDE